MKAQKIEGLKEYLAETRGLERDYVGEVLASRRVAWRVAVASLVLAGVSVGAVMGLTPLKRTEAVVLRVNDSTGHVDVVSTIADAKASYGEVVDKYFLNQYVLNRESYDYNTIQANYDTTALLSAPDVQREYIKLYAAPDSRDKVLKNSARILVRVKSITPNSQLGTAVVRFATQKVTFDGVPDAPQDWIATLGYHYVNAPTTEVDRRVNPLGFQVRSYRVDPEVVSSR